MIIRLDSFLSKYGVCSRRKAKTLIDRGLVTVNGVLAQEVAKIDSEKDLVAVEGNIINPKGLNYKYIAFNKPLSVLSTTSDEWGRKTVLDYVKVSEKVYPVGRLDYNSTGLMLLTNDGDFALKMTHPRYHVSKKYLVEVSKPIKDAQLDEMAKGVSIEGSVTMPAEIRKLSHTTFEITLHQGLKRQIREMCRAVGLEVASLKRFQIGTLTLGNLKTGEFRDLTKAELKALIQTSSSLNFLATIAFSFLRSSIIL